MFVLAASESLLAKDQGLAVSDDSDLPKMQDSIRTSKVREGTHKSLTAA